MTINSAYKKLILYLMLFATLGATFYYMFIDKTVEFVDDVVMPTEGSSKREVRVKTESAKITESQRLEDVRVDVFEVYKAVRIEPKRQPVVRHQIVKKKIEIAPEPIVIEPSAPPMPFKYIGKIWGDDEFQVFVGFKGKYLVVKEGDIIQKTYKVEKIAPPVMTVTYMPMNILQNMQIGEMN